MIVNKISFKNLRIVHISEFQGLTGRRKHLENEESSQRHASADFLDY